jgi:N-acetylmuramoyl-L-alanine amidase
MRNCVEGCAIAVLLVAMATVVRAQGDAEALYREATARETVLRKEIDGRRAGAPAAPLLQRARTLAQTYEDIARLFPRSTIGDDALWQGGVLAADAFWEFGQAADRDTALRLLTALETRYPSSTLVRQVAAQTTRLRSARIPTPTSDSDLRVRSPTPTPVLLKAIRREALSDALRVTLELEREVPFYDERMEGPPRVLIDLNHTRAVDALNDARLTFADDVVRRISVGRPIETRTRVVLDLQDAARHSVYALYSPYRIVIDVERRLPTAAKGARSAAAAPVPPVTNGTGSFSLSRQLGLGVARVVIDPGHGGHDPGAQVKDLNEAELTLDIASRLERLLLKQPGVEVVLTRRTDAYVSLEERTAIANRAAADLFLSIHANASADLRARGIETYFLNFASNSAAEALAARENAGSARTMRELPDIVKAIALNNKIDESRDFATFVQSAMFTTLRRANRQVRNLGVKQAPFVVLIGATMPSVLAEISFLTNRQEATLLRTPKYRDQIADALFNGVMKYQRSLKAAGAGAAQ